MLEYNLVVDAYAADLPVLAADPSCFSYLCCPFLNFVFFHFFPFLFFVFRVLSFRFFPFPLFSCMFLFRFLSVLTPYTCHVHGRYVMP